MIQTQMFNDEQILDKAFRIQIIKEIQGSENVSRKQQQASILQVLRDDIRKFVLQRLQAQGFKAATLAVMNQRASNVNLLKKIVSKKARSYSKGASRTVEGDEAASKDIETVATALKLNESMKRADTYRKAAKNCMLYIYPDWVEDLENPGSMVYSLCSKVFFPHHYDAIPDAKDKEKMRCFILSPFTASASAAVTPSAGKSDGRDVATATFSNPVWRRDGVDQKIANSPEDSGAPPDRQEYVFWTTKYHLTCDQDGEIIAEKTPTEGLPYAEGKVGPKNPIMRLPCVNLTEQQDGEFWAMGGQDLMEGTILVNLKLTDMESILHQQGWGQIVVTGEDLAKKDFQVGPHVILAADTAKGAAFRTEIQLISHDPHTEEHLKSTEVHVALMLTTNNLSVKSVATNLDASSVASAIAKMVDESENMDDISEDQGYYGEKEKQAFLIAEGWLGTMRDVPNTAKELKETKPLKVAKMNTQFHNQEQVVSEQERLANLKTRKEIGIDAMVDLIKKDNPNMNDEMAQKKLLSIINERKSIQALDPTFLAAGQGQAGGAVAQIELAQGGDGELPDDPAGVKPAGNLPGTPPKDGPAADPKVKK